LEIYLKVSKKSLWNVVKVVNDGKPGLVVDAKIGFIMSTKQHGDAMDLINNVG
jgi:hypothetical protein